MTHYDKQWTADENRETAPLASVEFLIQAAQQKSQFFDRVWWLVLNPTSFKALFTYVTDVADQLARG